MFCLQQSRYLRLSMVQQSLSCLPRIRSRWFLFIRSEIYLLPTYKKCDCKKNHAHFNLHFQFFIGDIYRLVKLDFLVLLLFLVNYPPSMTTLRFQHSSSMNISLGKSMKFPVPVILILSCSSSNVLTLFEGFSLQ